MSIKVLVLLNNIPLYGSERANINVYYALKEKQINSLFVTHSKYGNLYVNPYLDYLELDHVPANYIGKICRRESFKEYFFELKNSLKGNIELLQIINKYKPDFIHIPTEASFISMLIALFLNRIPVIYRVGDAPRRNRRIFTLIWKRLIIPRVYRFVCISNFIKYKLLDLGINEEKISVIYNSPPHRINNNQSISEELKISNRFNVAYVGQISEDKGVDILIEAAIQLCKKYPNIYFYLAGDYSWKNPFAEQLIADVKKSGLSDRIKFLGMLENVKELLENTHLHVCPSVWEEPLSNVVVEAKEAGLPSVIFPSGGLTELIRHDVDGFICINKSVLSLIEGIEYYYCDPHKLIAAGIEAKNSMLSLGITKDAYIEKWFKIFQH